MTTSSSSSRSYADAIDALNSLQTPFAVLEARRKAGQHANALDVRQMRAYLARTGCCTPQDLDRLNVVHVAGTKGKGSTCAFVDSILNQHRLTRNLPLKTGLLTSPHLVAVRERIRINAQPLSEAAFARYFFEVWDLLAESNADPEGAPAGSRPTYARFLTLLGLHVFRREGVDAAVLETGLGGEYDSTNVVDHPAAVGITTLGLDHVESLGRTIDKIAWHKGGIIKSGCPAFTVEQAPEAAAVLDERAREKGAQLTVLPVDPRLKGVEIRPKALFQRRNASLAIALAETVLRRIDPSVVTGGDALSREFVDGLEKVVWRGRCEVLPQGKVVWHVDGAHTADSLKVASRWFGEETAGKAGPRALIFNQQGRAEALDFLDAIFHAAWDSAGGSSGSRPFDHVVFCTNVTYAATGYKRDFVNRGYDAATISGMTVQHKFAERWTALDPSAKVVVLPTIEEALGHVRSLSQELGPDEAVHAFVTGSLHLVGGALGILEGVDAL